MSTKVDKQIHTFDCGNPWFSLIKEGKKVVEGRLCSKKYLAIKSGDILKLTNENEFIMLNVESVAKYDSFENMIKVETLERILPSIKTIENGVEIYRQFYKSDIEKEKGVLAITVNLI